jgi:hypothetical protein
MVTSGLMIHQEDLFSHITSFNTPFCHQPKQQLEDLFRLYRVVVKPKPDLGIFSATFHGDRIDKMNGNYIICLYESIIMMI